MKVTKFIREYVEQEINRKYREKVESLHSGYKEEKQALYDKLDAIVTEANEKANKLVSEAGFERVRFSSGDMISRYGYISKPEIEDKINKESNALRQKADEAIRETLLALELGFDSKEELTAILDSVTF